VEAAAEIEQAKTRAPKTDRVAAARCEVAKVKGGFGGCFHLSPPVVILGVESHCGTKKNIWQVESKGGKIVQFL